MTNVFCSKSLNSYYTKPTEIIFCLIHGAGLTSHSFFCIFEKLEENGFGCLAIDIPGHGKSQKPKNYTLLELSTMILDLISLFLREFPIIKKCIFVGHSMGGTIAVDLALKMDCLGLVVVDCMEKDDLDMQATRKFLSQRPKNLTEQEAIKWAVDSNYSPSLMAAKNTIPHQLQNNEWITDVLSLEPLWKQWFLDFNVKFLKLTVQKVIISTKSTLDKTLTIAQMQGKFQLKIMGTHHLIHEQNPMEFSSFLINFAQRIK